MEVNKTRITLFDIMRGLAIIAVVSGHCDVAQRFFYIFHVPVFFFVAGMLAHPAAENISCLKNYFKKLFVRLYLPFVAFEMCALALHNLFFKLSWYDTAISFNEFLLKTIRVLTMGGGEQLVGSLWFLISLLEISIIFDLFLFIIRKNTKALQTILLIIFALGLCAIGYFTNLPRLLSISLYFFIFYATGYLMRAHIQTLQVCHIRGGYLPLSLCYRSSTPPILDEITTVKIL